MAMKSGGAGREKLTPKQVWKALVGEEGAELLHDGAELLVRRTDLRVFDRLPSYRAWRDQTERALRVMHFL
ncbi:hypothetical protein QEZ40_002555 [Streptomyces katrae]|uniref:Uncharacterized protein n=1 Tax=Streptomyces katrae TaxID=68223 RepID=A0ABT7GXI2_9ACTN|nr:hypothetical protein [Streptomyces katrae]MDK9497614.1 hypothetical protein [Streptomyces katrae]